MKHCRIWAAVLSVSVALPFTSCSHMPTSMLPTAAREKVLDSRMAAAKELEVKKELEKAQKAYESIHKADPNRVDTCHRLAIVSYRLGQREQAIKSFEKAKKLAPKNPEVLSDYGYALHKMDKNQQAEAVLKESVKIDPKSERAITRLATVLGSQGKMQESYTQLCRISTPAEAHEIVAHLHGKRGEKRQALNHYQKSLALSKIEASGRGKLKKGSKEYKTNEQLLKRVEQNIAQLSSDPALKAAQSKTQLVGHTRFQKAKSEVKTAGAEKKLFRKVTDKITQKIDNKKLDQKRQTKVAKKKESPFRIIRERVVKEEERPRIRNPFLNDPVLSESAFKDIQTDDVQTEIVSTEETRSKTKQKKKVLLDKVLDPSVSSSDSKEKIAFRRMTEEDVNRVAKHAEKSEQKQTVAVIQENPFVKVDRKSTARDERSIEKIVRKKHTVYELMRELQTELISDFSPEEATSNRKEQLGFRVIREPETKVEQPRFSKNQKQIVTVESPFDRSSVAQVGKWKPAEPVFKNSEKKQPATFNTKKLNVQPVEKNRKSMIQNVSLSQPKREVIKPLTPVAMCPEAKGDVLELVQQLDSKDTSLLKQSVQRLGDMQANAKAAVPAIRPLLKHGDMGVRIQTAFSLWKIEGSNNDSIPTLIHAMNSSVESNRSFAAAVLAQIGVQTPELTPILVRSLSDENDYVRLHTAELLAQNSDWKYQANKTLAECLLSKDVNIRWLATYSLAELIPEDDRVVAGLSIALQDKASQVRAGAAYALGEIGPYAHKSIPELQKARFDSNSEVRIAAKNALSRVRRVSPPSAN